MKTLQSTILAILSAAVLANPVAAQEQDVSYQVLVDDIGASIAEVESELAAIGERAASDDWMVFESASHGLVQVDLIELRRLVPVVRSLREQAEGSDGSTSTDGLRTASPALWQARTLLADAPVVVLEDGPDAVVAWLWDYYGHLQTPGQRGALYEAYEGDLSEKREALRLADEVFMFELAKQESFEGEVLHIQQWCRKVTSAETIASEAGVAGLGPDAPAVEDLPDWCAQAIAFDGGEDAR
jgi:hypothetical protein